MPLFVCSNCGCVDNTATGFYWMQSEKPLCAECGPENLGGGKWHGVFPKRKHDPDKEPLEPNSYMIKRNVG